MSKSRTMRIYANLPPFLWDELYLTASHLHAKTATRSLKGKTPWELWHGRTPDYSYLREIGCRAFVLILNKHNPKIYERSVECVFIGYDAASKSYRCYNRTTRQVYSSYHVCFLESHDLPPPGTATPMHPPHNAPVIEQVANDTVFEPICTDTDILDDQLNPLAQSSTHVISENESNPVTNPGQPSICKSARVFHHAPNVTTRIERAVQESKDSAACLKAHKRGRGPCRSYRHQPLL
jgi:hypothetical protein